jgi:hypothetical protein
MSTLKIRCERIRDEITLESFFERMGWEYEDKRRIHCVWPEHDDRSPAMQVYPDNQSVYCFACGKGGDVIALAQGCADPGNEMSVVEAVEWIESSFNMGTYSAPARAASRVSKKLSKWRQKTLHDAKPTRLDLDTARRDIDASFREVEAGVPHWILMEALAHKQYVLDSCGTQPEGAIAWAAWARAHIFGSYSRFLHEMQQPWEVPADTIDDRPETVALATQWDTHRGIELSSHWPVHAP